MKVQVSLSQELLSMFINTRQFSTNKFSLENIFTQYNVYKFCLSLQSLERRVCRRVLLFMKVWFSVYSVCQSQLPATGVPVTRQRADQMREMFEEYVKQRTLTNWKFWIVSLKNMLYHILYTYSRIALERPAMGLNKTVLSHLKSGFKPAVNLVASAHGKTSFFIMVVINKKLRTQ